MATTAEGSGRRKSIEAAIATSEDPKRSLRRDLSAWDLAVLGVAVAVGAGIFSVGAEAAANHAGPGVIISFFIASVVCGLAMMCYAEFASTLPIAGSAYTYSYATMGEVVAWIIGWDLILEMLLAAAVIAKFWGIYLGDAFELFGVDIPMELQLGPVAFDWGPALIVAVFTTLLVLGTKMSTRVNSVFTIIKVSITLFVIVVGFFYVKAENYSPFIPPAEPAESASGLHQPLFAWLTGLEPSMYGVVGVLSGAALVFFAFIGFDVVATTAEETSNPQRNLPRGILGGLGVVTVLYVLVTIVVTGMVSYAELAQVDDPSLTSAFVLVGADWAGKVISMGILVGLTSVTLVLLLGLTIFLIVYCYQQLKDEKFCPEALRAQLIGLMGECRVQSAIKLATESPTYLGRLVAYALPNIDANRTEDLGKDAIEDAIADFSANERPQTMKYVDILALAGSIAPSIGLFGTVQGMIMAFGVLATTGQADPSDLAGSISIALLTTFWGLIISIIAIPAFFLYKKKAQALEASCINTVEEMVNTSINVINAEAQLARIPEGLDVEGEEGAEGAEEVQA